MNGKIRVGIMGYGNLGRGVELALRQNSDMETVAVFTRREPSSVKTLCGTPVVSSSEIERYKDKVDVMILCGGSATDLISQTVEYASLFNVVDSFDTHARIPEHFEAVNEAAKEAGKTAMISSGWDPGLFSMNRVMAESVLPDGKTYTFWGKGLSQGHSDAVRRIEGVKRAVQYTVPVNEALDAVRAGEKPEFTAREMHRRVCFVVAEDGADIDRIKDTIVTMPNYFEPYDTEVNFISEEEFIAEHTAMPHGGLVVRSGSTGIDNGSKQTYEFSLNLDSNPEFTSSMLVATARAVMRLHGHGARGCFTVLDVPVKYFSMKSDEELRKYYL